MDTLALATRIVHVAAVTLATGVFGFLLLVARPAFEQERETLGPERERLDRLLLRIAGLGLAGALVSGCLWLWVQSAMVTGRGLADALGPDALGRMVARTQVGHVWALRMGLLVLLGGLLLFRDTEARERDWLALRLEGLVLAGAVAAGLAWAGHAGATQGDARIAHLVADTVHLLATALWLGALLPLAILLSRAIRAPGASWAAVAREATRRFSRLALASVGALVLTGSVNAWILVGDIPALAGTPYGRLLLMKLALFLAVVGIAAVNLLRLRPALSAADALGSGDGAGGLLRRLRRNVIAEACLGMVIVAIVGVLQITPPGRHTQPSWPFPVRLSWEVTRDLPRVRLAVGAGAAGALVGSAVVACAVARRRRRWGAAAVGAGVMACSTVLALHALAIDAYPTTYLRPARPYSAPSIFRAAALYREHCAGCHGMRGHGDGPAAAGLARRPADLTATHAAHHTAGDLFWWLSHGIEGSPMPGFGDRLTVQDRWDLINLLRALADGAQARRLQAVVQPLPWLVAPDFSFGMGVGPAETLRDQRGWAMVHLVLFSLPSSLTRLEELDRSSGEIGLAGARVLAVPMRDAAVIYRKLGARVTNIPVGVDGSPEIVQAYTLLLGPQGPEDRQPLDHLEALIDRQGYIRARWVPGVAPGWWEIPALLREIRRLDREAPAAPAPDTHVH